MEPASAPSPASTLPAELLRRISDAATPTTRNFPTSTVLSFEDRVRAEVGAGAHKTNAQKHKINAPALPTAAASADALQAVSKHWRAALAAEPGQYTCLSIDNPNPSRWPGPCSAAEAAKTAARALALAARSPAAAAVTVEMHSEADASIGLRCASAAPDLLIPYSAALQELLDHPVRRGSPGAAARRATLLYAVRCFRGGTPLRWHPLSSHLPYPPCRDPARCTLTSPAGARSTLCWSCWPACKTAPAWNRLLVTRIDCWWHLGGGSGGGGGEDPDALFLVPEAGLHGLPHLSRLDVVAPLPLVLGLSLPRLETLSLSGVDGGMGGAIPAATLQLGYGPPPPGTDTALPPLPLFPALRHVSAEVGTLLLDVTDAPALEHLALTLLPQLPSAADRAAAARHPTRGPSHPCQVRDWAAAPAPCSKPCPQAASQP